MFRKLAAGSLVVSLALVGGVAVAQTNAPQHDQAQGTTGNQANAPKQLSAADRKFLEHSYQGNLAEVQLGKLAAEHAQSDAVKSFAKRMVDDHGKLVSDQKDLAQKKGVTLSDTIAPAMKTTEQQLSQLQGQRFDERYMTNMIQEHTKDVAEFEREAKTAQDPDVKEWAQKTLPTLQEHLKEAKNILAEEKKAGNASQRPSQQHATPQGTEPGTHQGTQQQNTQPGTNE
jgi:putative membrane protein